MTKQEFINHCATVRNAYYWQTAEFSNYLDAVIQSEIEARTTSLWSLIERVAAEKMCKPPKGNEDWEYNQGLDKAIEILKSTPCIKAKAQKNIVGEYFVLKNFGKLDKNVPEFDIEILLP